MQATDINELRRVTYYLPDGRKWWQAAYRKLDHDRPPRPLHDPGVELRCVDEVIPTTGSTRAVFRGVIIEWLGEMYNEYRGETSNPDYVGPKQVEELVEALCSKLS